MRTVELNGYIDEEAWFGDEVTPESLHALLYPEGADAQEDLRIILNSYGGSCNAAVRMFDDLRAYPAVYDLDGDGKLDLICGSSDGRLYFYKGKGYNSRMITEEAEACLLYTSPSPRDRG